MLRIIAWHVSVAYVKRYAVTCNACDSTPTCTGRPATSDTCILPTHPLIIVGGKETMGQRCLYVLSPSILRPRTEVSNRPRQTAQQRDRHIPTEIDTYRDRQTDPDRQTETDTLDPLLSSCSSVGSEAR